MVSIPFPPITISVPTRIVALHIEPGIDGGHTHKQDRSAHKESDIGNGSGHRNRGRDGFVSVFIEESTVIGHGGGLGGEASSFDLVVCGGFCRIFRCPTAVLRRSPVTGVRTSVRFRIATGSAGSTGKVGTIAAGGDAGFISGFIRGRRFRGDFEVGAVAGVVVCGGKVKAVGAGGEIAWGTSRRRFEHDDR